MVEQAGVHRSRDQHQEGPARELQGIPSFILHYWSHFFEQKGKPGDIVKVCEKIVT